MLPMSSNDPIFGFDPNNFILTESAGDYGEHLVYIKYHETLPMDWYGNKEKHKEDVKECKKLFEKKTTIEEKRKTLFKLAHIGMLESITAIEDYLKNPDDELENWAKMCFDECRMFLEGEELGENKVMVSPIKLL